MLIEEGRKATWELLDEAQDCRLKLLANGYTPVPVNGKAPVIANWQNPSAPDEAEIKGWTQTCNTATNTGVLCNLAPTVDIDVLDVNVADELEP